MKKILLCLALLCLAACSSPSGERLINVYDTADIISPQVERTIQSAHYYDVPVIVATYNSLSMQNLNDFCEAEFDKYAEQYGDNFKYYGVLVVASANPNLAVAKFGDRVEEWNHGAPDYGSMEYFAAQMDDVPVERKILLTIEKAMNYRLMESNIVAYIRGELFGNLYTGLVKPDDGFFYRYVVYPCQWPFIQMLKLTKSFYLAMLLVALLLYLVYRGLIMHVVRSKRNYLGLQAGQPQQNIQKVQAANGCLAALIFNIPFIVGGLSFAISFGIGGVEHIQAIVDGMGLPVDVVTKMFESSLSQTSVVGAMVVAVLIWIAEYDKKNHNAKTTLKVAAFAVVLLLSPRSVLWAVFLFYLLPVIHVRAYKAFWDDTYIHFRINGFSRIGALFWTILSPAVVCLGILLGTHFGSIPQRTFEFENIDQIEFEQQEESHTATDALQRWYDKLYR